MGLLGRIGRAWGRIFATPAQRLDRLDYDDYWDNRSLDDIHPRFPLIAKLVPHGSRVMDIGSGDGSLLLFLARERNATGHGVDISRHAVEHARRRGVSCDVADITHESFHVPAAFDVVIVSEVLEHIADPEAVLIRLRRDGIRRLIITVPNTGYVEHRLRLLVGRFPVQWLLHPGEHLRFWTISDFHATASATGFTVHRVVPALGWFPLARFWPALFASQVVYELVPAAHSSIPKQ